MTDKPSEILARAADILMERGWAKEFLVTSDGRVCLRGAIACAVTGRVGGFGTDTDIALAGYHVRRIVGRSVEGFNDAPGTTFDMVLGALHDAQLAAKEAGQ